MNYCVFMRALAASNYGAERLAEAVALSESEGWARYVAVQPHYNLVHRDEYEGPLLELCQAKQITCFPYYGLASGFLTGKYRSGGGSPDERRAGSAKKFLDDRGEAVLKVVDEVAAAHGVSMAAVALGWLASRPTVGAPIAGVRVAEQLDDLLAMVKLDLSADELAALEAVSAS